jgi:hypothetical protein
LKILIVAAKKQTSILEFGRELGKENWSLEICVALYLFSGSIIVRFNF